MFSNDANPTDVNPTEPNPAAAVATAPADDLSLDEQAFDETGKVTLDHIYTQPDPRSYFRTLRQLDYVIPQLAKPYFGRLVDECRTRLGRPTTVLDVGCSYGVNAALQRCDLTMDDMYDRYGQQDGPKAGQDRAVLLARDRQLVHSRRSRWAPRFVGLDSSRPAVRYGLAAGFLDDAVCADLESREATADERTVLASADLVVSTGCIGYVSERTIDRIARAGEESRRPWMAHFVLRMFPFDPFEAALDALGYDTVHVEGVYPQRRFASAQEQEQVLDTLSAVGVDPTGLESDGWMYAQLHMSRPRGVGQRAALAAATSGVPIP
ncbi:class I SAM-dependent methyltransferase [Frankia sp. AgKG'84/4]|uniref:class I SAM-dependent methyltransferase n=1 Tax=Frankia sp. AgKG'84/4 TaxID=573490 RepID=UPI00200CA88C|nr:class I SAM-dependent methyltransferase [Frankia sp. AgKG'84/4]MCL9795405.1 class I SAM-dependent methyltransferase [Frankia sp. AgKG'84/4]